MSSEKRFPNASSHHHADKSGNGGMRAPGGSLRNGGSQGQTHQNNKQRARGTGGVANSKVAAPRPLNLPSLRKESERNDSQTQAPQAQTGTSGWQRPDGGQWDAEQHTSWSHHPLPRNWAREHYMNHSTPSTVQQPVLNQDDFPSLETATHLKGQALSKTKPQTSATTGPENSDEKGWTQEGHEAVSQSGSNHPTWEDDDRYGSYGPMPVRYGDSTMPHTHGYRPMAPHGYDMSNPYGQGVYYTARPQYYVPPSGTMRPGYAEYYGHHPTDGYYAAYYHPMYAASMHVGYGHPEMYADQGQYPHTQPVTNGQEEKVTTHQSQGFDAENEPQPQIQSIGEQQKAEAEHPKTPDNQSGDSVFRQMTRQPSNEDRQSQKDASQRSILRKKSLPKDSATQQLKGRLPSEELDWDAQVDAEQRAMRREVKILPRASKESTQSSVPEEAVLDSHNVEANRWRHTREYTVSNSRPGQNFGRECHNQNQSKETPKVQTDVMSDASTPKTWHSHRPRYDNPRHDGWRHDRFEDRRSRPHRDNYDHAEPRFENWQNRRGSYHQERDYRGRGSRGRYNWPQRGGRGRGRNFGPENAAESRFSSSTPRGRCLFPGRGFRPKGPSPRDGTASNAKDVIESNTPAAIQFGEFAMSINGVFDPFPAKDVQIEGDEQLQATHRNDVADRDREPTHAIGPARMDQHRETAFVGNVLPDTEDADGGATPSTRRSYDRPRHSRPFGDRHDGFREQRGNYRGRGRGRGRWHYGRHYRPFGDHTRTPRSYDGASMSERQQFSEGDRDPPLSHRSANYVADTSNGHGGHRPDRRFSDRRDFRGGNGERRGGTGYNKGRGRGRSRDRDRGSFDSNPQSGSELAPRLSSNSVKMQWVPKKSPSATDKTE